MSLQAAESDGQAQTQTKAFHSKEQARSANSWRLLEPQLDGELHIACALCLGDDAECWLSKNGRLSGRPNKVRVIQKVERRRPEIQMEPFRYPKRLGNCHVPIAS